ncbi:hypothetical protein F4825DRAFT_197417 [Nemania diffusa]|nr:hypothetical protein F4825DRAFT_197417 [Nemania diffusa]
MGMPTRGPVVTYIRQSRTCESTFSWRTRRENVLHLLLRPTILYCIMYVVSSAVGESAGTFLLEQENPAAVSRNQLAHVFLFILSFSLRYSDRLMQKTPR